MYNHLIPILFMIVATNYFVICRYSQHDYRVIHEHATIKCLNKTIAYKCSLSNVMYNRTYRAYNINACVNFEVNSRNFKVKIQAFKMVNNQPTISIVTLTVKGCDVVNSGLFGGEEFLKAGNITKCPVKPGCYYVRNFNLDETKFPPLIPGGRYKVVITLIGDNIIVAQAIIYAEVKYDIK